MKNKFAAIILTGILSLVTCVSAYAAPMTYSEAADALVKTNTGFRSYGSSVEIDVSEADHGNVWGMMQNGINDVFRSCSYHTLGSYTWYSDGISRYYVLNTTQLKELSEHQAAVEEWSRSVATQLFPDGMDRESAILTSFLHITRNYSYDKKCPDDIEKRREAQDAYYLITNGSGICASFAKTFRSLVEAVPFNPSTWTVDWKCSSPVNIKVAIVENPDIHEWAAIQENDSSWRYYDCTSLSCYALSGDTLDRFDCYGDASKRIWYY